MNGDGNRSNDLIYIPRDSSEMNFEAFGNYTVGDQNAAWEEFIRNDDYLKNHRGKYAKRNGVRLPMVYRADLSLVQEVFRSIRDNRHSLQFRLDILNFGNLLNKKWGVSQSLVTTTPLTPRGIDGQGRSIYRLREVGGELITKPLQYNAGIADVWRIQIGFRYSFN
jgi:hypothetical protein